MDILGLGNKAIALNLERENILPGPGAYSKENNRPNEKAVAGPLRVPILEGLPGDKNGFVEMYGANINGANLDHIFSFTYYLPEGKEFVGSPYYYGLECYIQLAHGILLHNEKPFPYKCGVIIYTDRKTLPELERNFPLERYPNLTLALVDWPFFTDSYGNVNDTILRCLRFHAVEHFQTKNVHMRDADTLHAIPLLDIQRERKKGFTTEIPALLEQFHSLIFRWETRYFEFIPLIEEKGKQIVFGSHSQYKAAYHKNLPYPVAFKFPMRRNKRHVTNKPNPDEYLYVLSDELKWENSQKIRKIYGNILHGNTRRNFTKETKEVIPSNLQARIKNIYTRRNKLAYGDPKRNALEEEIKKIASSVEKNLADKVPPKNRRHDPFSRFFENKYMFDEKIGVYAGFVSVFKNRKGIEDFWKLCVEYLLQRYYMIPNIETGKQVTTNELLKNLNIDYWIGRKDVTTVIGVGKDERMLLYGVAPKYLDSIFILPVAYSTDLGNVQSSGFYDIDKYFNTYVSSWFGPGAWNFFSGDILNYKEWLSDFYKKYPTEKAFLNAVNTNLAERFIPYNVVKAENPGEVAKNAARPYDYPPSTLRRGGTRKYKKHSLRARR